MRFWASLSMAVLGAGAIAACGGADQSSLLDDSGAQQPPPDASVTKDSSTTVDAGTDDVTVQDVTIPDVVTVDVPTGPADSLIACGGNLTCSAQTQICCHHAESVTQWECVTDASDCNGVGDVPIGCSGHDNCVSQGEPNDICCADTQFNGSSCSVATDVSCQATCDANAGQFQVGCSNNDPCQGTDVCKQSTCSLVGYDICVSQ